MLTHELAATAMGICLLVAAGVVALVYVPPLWLIVLVPVMATAAFLRIYGRRHSYTEIDDIVTLV